MGVVSVTEIWAGRRGSLDHKAVREYSHVYRIVTDSPLTGPAELLAASNLATLGKPYSDFTGQFFDLGALVKSIACNQDTENPYVWEVVVDYSSDYLDQQQRDAQQNEGKPTENPTDKPPQFTWAFHRFQRVARADLEGNAIKNSAGEPFSPLPEVDESRPVLTMVRNEPILDPLTMQAYQDSVNSDVFLGVYEPGTVKLSLGASSKWENGMAFWEVTYTFEFREFVTLPTGNVQVSGWDLAIVDQGSYYLDAGKRKRDLDVQTGAPVNPILLDGAGGKLPLNDPEFYMTFGVYKRMRFADLNIPPTITPA